MKMFIVKFSMGSYEDYLLAKIINNKIKNN